MNTITFEQAWNYGGPLMWVLAFFSVMSLTVMLYLWLTQRQGSFIREMLPRLKDAKDPAAEGGRIAERVFAAVDWLADIAAIRCLGRCQAGRARPGRLPGDRHDDLRPRGCHPVPRDARDLPSSRFPPDRGTRGEGR